jgi:hypothetical protein
MQILCTVSASVRSNLFKSSVKSLTLTGDNVTIRFGKVALWHSRFEQDSDNHDICNGQYFGFRNFKEAIGHFISDMSSHSQRDSEVQSRHEIYRRRGGANGPPQQPPNAKHDNRPTSSRFVFTLTRRRTN